MISEFPRWEVDKRNIVVIMVESEGGTMADLDILTAWTCEECRWNAGLEPAVCGYTPEFDDEAQVYVCPDCGAQVTAVRVGV